MSLLIQVLLGCLILAVLCYVVVKVIPPEPPFLRWIFGAIVFLVALAWAAHLLGVNIGL